MKKEGKNEERRKEWKKKERMKKDGKNEERWKEWRKMERMKKEEKNEGRRTERKIKEKGRINEEERDGKGYGIMNLLFTSNQTHFIVILTLN